MNKKTLLITLASGMAFVALPLLAQGTPSNGGVSSTTVSSTTNAAIRAQIEGAREDYKAQREAAQASLAASRADFKKKMEDARTALKTELATKKALLKDKLKTIKDEKKKKTVQKVNDSLQNINVKVLDALTQVVNNQEDLLQKITARVDVAQSRSIDVTQVRADIAQVTTDIANARAAILAQSKKVYSINITTEATLKANTLAERNALKNDLEAVRNLVKVTRAALVKTITDLASVKGIEQVQASVGAGATASSTNH